MASEQDSFTVGVLFNSLREKNGHFGLGDPRFIGLSLPPLSFPLSLYPSPFPLSSHLSF